MRRAVILILPLLVVVAVWLLAAKNGADEPRDVAAAVEVDVPAETPVADEIPTITATPRPPRKVLANSSGESESSAPSDVSDPSETSDTIDAEAPDATPLTDPETAKPVYTPRPARGKGGALKTSPSSSSPATAQPAESGYASATAVGTPFPASLTSAKTIRQGLPGSNLVALTFDDGPTPEKTPQLLKYLRENNVPATFFLLGENVEKDPALVIEEAEFGFELGNHSYNHKDFKKESEQSIRLQIQNTSELIEQTAGVRPTVLRPPYGNSNDAMRAICEEMKLDVILWSVDTNDWREGRTVEGIMETVQKDLKGGSIILMHDHAPHTLETVPLIVELVKQRGLKLATVSELVHELRSGQVQPPANSAGVAAAAN